LGWAHRAGRGKRQFDLINKQSEINVKKTSILPFRTLLLRSNYWLAGWKTVKNVCLEFELAPLAKIGFSFSSASSIDSLLCYSLDHGALTRRTGTIGHGIS
jgi:ribosome modulation factor